MTIYFAMTSDTSHSCLVDIFYHIRQVVARVAKLVLRGAFVTPVLEEGEGRSYGVIDGTIRQTDGGFL